MSRLGPAGIGAAVALACALAFLPALRGGLVWDDAGTIPRPGPLAAAFTRSFWSPGPASAAGPDSYYRPLVNLSLGLDRLVGGQRAWYFHLVNLLLHGAAVFAFFALVRESSGAPAAVAAVAALLFGLQRLSADSVAYVSGRTDLLAGLGLLLALLGLLRYARAGGWRHGLLALAGFAVAVFSKESGAGFVVFAGGWLAGTRAVRRRWPVLAGLAAVGVAYLVARWTVLGSLVGLRPGPAGQTLALALNSTGFLLFDLCLPFNRGLFLWRPGEFGVLTSYAAPALAFLALPVLVAWSLRRPPPAGRQAEVGVSVNAGLNALLGWGWAAVFLLPFSGLVQFGPIGRLAYVPAAGLIVFAVVMADRLLRGRPAARRVAAALAVGWCVATLPFLWQRIGWWRSEAGLFRRMASDAPAYAPGHYNLGNALLTARDSAGAVAAYARAVGLDSSLAPAALNLGALLQARGDLDEAAALYRSAVSRRPDYAPAHANLGVVLHKLGDTGGAIAELRRAAGLDPANAGTAYNLAWLFRLAGEPDSARAWAERAFRLRPQDPRTRRLFEQTRRPPVTGA